MKTKLIFTALLFAATIAITSFWSTTAQSIIGRQAGVSQVNGGDTDFAILQATQTHKDHLPLIAWLIFSAVIAILFWPHAKKALGVVVLIALCSFSTGCIKPYDKPEFVEIGNNETGFLVPLEGDTANQAKFESEQQLSNLKIAAKRIQVTHRWNQTGRFENDGEYIPTVRLIKVDRSPVTREWDADRMKNTAIWVESADSVGFSMGFNVTAFIAERDAAKFLYWYPSGSLTTVMDTEIRGRIQQCVANFAAKYKLDELRYLKGDIAKAINEDVTPFYSVRGITITSIGQYGGMTYENKDIQASIDAVFVAQQQKNVALAEWEAQTKRNDKITLSAQAEKQRQITEKEGEARGIELVLEALGKASQNPLFIQSKALDVQRSQIEKWNGAFPSTFMGGNPGILLQVQTPTK